MFTKHIPRTGNPVGKSHSVFTRVGAGLSVVSLTAGLALVAVAPANAAETLSTYAEAQFLSGTIVGTDLANVASLASAEARNNGTQPLQTSKDPLDAEVIRTVNIESPGGIQADLGQFLDAGVVGQYAEAGNDGHAMAAAGAIGNDGAIGVGSVGGGAAGDLTLDLNALLGSQFTSVITDLKLRLDAVSAQAVGSANQASGDYTLADATLTLNSPAIAHLTDKVNSALAVVDGRLLNMQGDDGVLGNAVDGVLDPVLGVIGSSANVDVSITSDLHAAVQALLDGSYGNGAVHFNLETGAVTVDLETLLGGELNDLPPGTELLTDAVVNQILKGITDTVATLADQIVDKVELALHNAKVSVHADLNLLTGQDGASTQVCHDEQVPIIGNILGPVVGGVRNLLGQLTGGTQTYTQGIIGYATNTVCNLVQNVLPDLQSTVNVDVEGTVDQLLNGEAATANANVSLLGGTVQTAVNVDAIIGNLGNGLLDGLFDSDGAVTDLVNSLNSGLVNPAVTGLLGPGSIQTALTDVLSIKVNLQELSLASAHGAAVANGQVFTETAVRVAALSGNVATVNVAAASVGPNATVIVPPTCTNAPCPPGGNPDPCIGVCTNGNPVPPVTAADRLAYTGVGIATLIAIILALLAAGAYLAREGYRRNHPKSLSTD